MNGWQTIVAIIDAAQPLQLDSSGDPKQASEASTQDSVAPRDRARRGRSSSLSADDDASESTQSSSADDSPSPPATAPILDGDESVSSQMGANDRPANGGGSGGDPPETPQQFNLRLAFLRQTDLGNVFRFVERNRGKLLYNESLPGSATQGGGWLSWDDRRWSNVGADAKVRIAEHQCVQAINDEAKACFNEADRLAKKHADIVERAPPPKKKKGETKPAGDNVITIDFRARKRAPKDSGESSGDGLPSDDDDGRDAAKIAARITTLYALGITLREWARKSEANSKMTPIARHAAAYLRVDLCLLDADPLSLNVLNGTLVFRREWNEDVDKSLQGHRQWLAHGAYVKFKPHNPDDRVTKLAPVVFDPAAEAPRWLSFLTEVQPEADMRRFLQQWKGYQTTGETGEARTCIFHGTGRNGKGVFEDATGFVLGDYAGSTPVKTFLLEGIAKGAGQATPELAKLPGLRSLRTSEPGKDAKLDESLVKQVTGGDPIDARHLNRPFFTFLPEFKLTMLTNHKPRISGVDEGIWSRVTLVPWSVYMPREKRDMQLARKLRREASGILNWMLDGLSSWLEHGLQLPGAVVDATTSYRSESDPLGQFLATCTEPAPGDKVQATPFHELFGAWAKAHAGPDWSPRGLSLAMQARGYRAMKVSVMYWLDIRLTKQISDFIDADGRPRLASSPAMSVDGGDDYVFE